MAHIQMTGYIFNIQWASFKSVPVNAFLIYSTLYLLKVGTLESALSLRGYQ